MRYRLTCLTPTLAGDGQRLSPIDYMVWKDQVNVLDQRKIFKLLAKGPRLDGYLTQLKKSTRLDFAAWGGFAQNFSGRRIPFEHPSMTGYFDRAQAEDLFIPTFAQSAQGAYLPASALKGALRTGVVFSRWNHGTMEEALGRLAGERSTRRVSAQAESQAVGGSGMDRMRFIMAADSAAVPAASLKVYLLRVATMAPRGGDKVELAWKVAGRSVPRASDSKATFAEMAAPGTVFEGDWSEKDFLKQPEITKALNWRKPDRADVFRAANGYARAQLDAHAQYAQATGLAEVRAEVEGLRSKLDAVEASGGCVLNLGWGGGFLSKAGYLDTTDESYRSILKGLPFYNRAIQSGLPFPKTRRIVFLADRPATLPGWSMLEVS